MPTDQKISELTPNTSITGSEEVPTERGGSNYKNTYTDLKTWILTGLGIGVNSVSGNGVGGTPTDVIMTFPNTSEVIETVDKNYVTDADKVVLGNTSNVNTGDQDLSSLALKSNVLELDNTTVFTPSSDYEPATRRFVLDNAVGSGVNSVSGQGVSGTLSDVIMTFPNTSEVSETTNNNYTTDAEKIVLNNTSNVNTGDESTVSIQSKRAIKTAGGESLEGIGDAPIVTNTILGEPSGSSPVQNIVVLTQSEYDSGVAVNGTMYVIIG